MWEFGKCVCVCVCVCDHIMIIVCSVLQVLGLFSLIFHYFHELCAFCGYWYTPATSALFESWLVSNKLFVALICNFLISSQMHRAATSALEKPRLLDPGFVVFMLLIHLGTFDSFMAAD